MHGSDSLSFFFFKIGIKVDFKYLLVHNYLDKGVTLHPLVF